MLTSSPTTLERTTLEVEQMALGRLLESPRLFDTWSLSEDHFAEPFHRLMFRLMAADHAVGASTNAAILAARVQHEAPISENCSTAEYVRRVQVAGFHAAPRCDIALKDLAHRRFLMRLADTVKFSAADSESDVRRIIADAIGELDTIMADGRGDTTAQEYGEALRDTLAELQSGGAAERITTGLKTLDQRLGGYHRGQFVLLAGRPSMGKSMIAMSSILRTARRGHGVAVFSLEMSKHELICRSLSDIAWTRDRPIPYAKAMAGTLSEDELTRWGSAAAGYDNIPMVIDDQRGLTVSEIASRARKIKKKMEDDGGHFDLIVVDHLGLVKPSGRYAGNKVNEVGEISDGLATLAKELDVCVLALQQLNRGVEGRENKRPGLSDLRNSGDLEQDAHVVMFAYRESYYLERQKHDAGTQAESERMSRLEACRNTAEILIAKNRNGPTDVVHVYCDPSCNAIRDLA